MSSRFRWDFAQGSPNESSSLGLVFNERFVSDFTSIDDGYLRKDLQISLVFS